MSLTIEVCDEGADWRPVEVCCGFPTAAEVVDRLRDEGWTTSSIRLVPTRLHVLAGGQR